MRVIESDFFDEKKDDRFAYESIEGRQFVAAKLASSPFHQRIDDGEKNAADELIQQNQTDGAKKSTGIDLSARAGENVISDGTHLCDVIRALTGKCFFSWILYRLAIDGRADRSATPKARLTSQYAIARKIEVPVVEVRHTKKRRHAPTIAFSYRRRSSSSRLEQRASRCTSIATSRNLAMSRRTFPSAFREEEG